jgi:ribonuclease HII
MARAVDQLSIRPDILIIDGTPAQPHATIFATNVIGGDATVFSIAAASILANVHRDQLMQDLAVEYPMYGFAGHKGYGSAAHLAALRANGPITAHRTSYAPVAAARRVPNNACRP